jgi:site-specific recombinase XerD
MTDEYAEYEKACERLRKDNGKLLQAFAEWLQSKGLSLSTVRKHRYNIDFYINHYLLAYEALEPAVGVSDVGMFLGDWFIRKAMWSNQAAIKSNAASLKKFYAFMHENGLVDKSELDGLNSEIKEGMPDWLETMERYANPDFDIDAVWGL